MPTSWWGKALVWGYAIGFWVRTAWIAVAAWPLMSFADWQWYMGWQMFWGIFWPITLVVGFVAGFAAGFVR